MTLKEEYNIYKEKTDKPFTYNYYTVLRYTLSEEDIIKRGRKSFIRGGGPKKRSKKDIDYIKYCYEHRSRGDWAFACAKVLGVSYGTIYNYYKS